MATFTIRNVHRDDDDAVEAALNKLPAPATPVRRRHIHTRRLGRVTSTMSIRHVMIAAVAVALLALLTPVVPQLTTKGAFVFAYVPPLVQHSSASRRRRRRHHSCTAPPTTAATTTLWSQPSQQQLPQPQDIWLVHWEGCVVDTVPWRIQTGMETASKLWPHCGDLLSSSPSSSSSSSSSTTWLSNKLAAVSHVLCEPPPLPLSAGDGDSSSTSVSAAYTLAVRLFLEEQKLDEGRSVGSRGKYGSQYHPQQEEQPEQEEGQPGDEEQQKQKEERKNREKSRGSRPLTVGEVGANWYDGACLCDTLPIKYKCPPLDLQKAVHETMTTILESAREEEEEIAKQQLLTVRNDVLDILVQAAATDPTKKILLTVSHPSDLATAQACLESALRGLPSDLLPCDLNVASSATDAMNMIRSMNSNMPNNIVLLPKSARTVADLLQTAPLDSTVHVLESSWQALQREIPLFGDLVPTRGPVPAGRDLGGWGTTSNLELLAADWAHAPDNTPLERAAAMSPWTSLLSLTELEECISARIVRN